MTSMSEEDYWYKHRDELNEGDIFITQCGSKVSLDRPCSSAEDLWYVVVCIDGRWFHNQDTIHLSELKTRIGQHYG